MIKNKWRFAFWICFVVLLFMSGLGFYSVLDQGVTITYMKQGYENTENDLNSIIDIVNFTDYSKASIEQRMKEHRFFDLMDFKMDTVSLERVELIFKNDTLEKINKQWCIKASVQQCIKNISGSVVYGTFVHLISSAKSAI